MSLSAKLRLGTIVMLWAPLAAAQNTLGALLDAGAKKLSPQEFREEVVQRVIAGPTATGGRLELVYADSGVIAGTGNYRDATSLFNYSQISGEWTIDEGRICTSMRLGPGPGVPTTYMGMILPPRCQFWFKYDEAYFLSDSDSDRSAKVLRRTLKQ
jgi:hypothetical protein